MISIVIIYILLYIVYKCFKNNINRNKTIKKLKIQIVRYKKYKISLYWIIIILSIIIFSLVYVFLVNYLKNIIAACILSLMFGLLPFEIYKYIVYINKEKIIKLFPNFAINIKNYVKVDNNIVLAFQKIYVESPLKEYISKFNISVNKGISIHDCFENLKKDINIKRINDFLSIVQFCYINGGKFEILFDKFIKQELEISLRKEKEKQKNFSSKLMLIILISLSIFVIFGVIMQDKEYYKIYTETILGKIIIIINSIIYNFIVYMYIKVNKLEE